MRVKSPIIHSRAMHAPCTPFELCFENSPARCPIVRSSVFPSNRFVIPYKTDSTIATIRCACLCLHIATMCLLCLHIGERNPASKTPKHCLGTKCTYLRTTCACAHINYNNTADVCVFRPFGRRVPAPFRRSASVHFVQHHVAAGVILHLLCT